MKKVIVAATMVGALLTGTMANAQTVKKEKKVSKTHVEKGVESTAATKEQSKTEKETTMKDTKMRQKGARTETTHKEMKTQKVMGEVKK